MLDSGKAMLYYLGMKTKNNTLPLAYEAVLKAAACLGSQAALARATGAPPQFITSWLTNRPVPTKWCCLIEAATNGQVTRKDLRPTDWCDHWPELKESNQ